MLSSPAPELPGLRDDEAARAACCRRTAETQGAPAEVLWRGPRKVAMPEMLDFGMGLQVGPWNLLTD